MRSEDLFIAGLEKLFGNKVLKLLANDRTIGRPKNQTLANLFIDMEEFKFFT